MRELKFRVWDGTEMHYPPRKGDITSFVLTQNGEVWNSDNCPLTPEEEKSIVVMQYTGLKDKNGKEIYEGDILQYIWKSANGAEWKETQQVFIGEHTSEEMGNIIVGVHTGSLSLDKDGAEKYEVIGNVHENPELLKK
ncbi:YopX protein [Candidatus Anstonella stagnisolia]|nr:YopX protein [Candidatus Anstonella stagnisolia]